MSRKKFDTISSELVISNRYWDYKLDKYVLPSGEAGEYHFIDSHGATYIIPMSANNTFFVIRQYRYLNKKYSLEFPGGGLKKGLSPEENAREELIEEAGKTAGNMNLIGEFCPYNGVTNEMCYVYFASELSNCEAIPEDSEDIEIIELSLEEINEKIKANEIWDGMSLAAWALFNKSEYYPDEYEKKC